MGGTRGIRGNQLNLFRDNRRTETRPAAKLPETVAAAARELLRALLENVIAGNRAADGAAGPASSRDEVVP